MIPDQVLGQNDTAPDFQVRLINRDRSFPDLTGRVVTCTVIAPGCCAGCPGRTFTTTAALVDAAGAYVGHAWQAAETSEEGLLQVYFTSRASAGDPTPIAYPWWGYYTVRVWPKVA